MMGDIPLKAGTKDTLSFSFTYGHRALGVDVELPFHA
jgi:hypothetical protein